MEIVKENQRRHQLQIVEIYKQNIFKKESDFDHKI